MTKTLGIVTLCISVIALFLNMTVLILLYKKHKRQKWTPMEQVLVHSYIATSIFILLFQGELVLKFSKVDLDTDVVNVTHALKLFLIHVNVRFLLVISLQRFVAVFFPFRAKSLVTSKKTRYAIIVVFTVSTLHYITYAVALITRTFSVQYILLKIRTIMGIAEMLLCVLLYLLIFIRLKLIYTRNKIHQQGGEQKKLVRSSIFCCALMVSMVTSNAPLTLYYFGIDNISRETSVVLIWIDPVFSAIWYIIVMRNVNTV
jgi:Serpentine type 7TM GPCR chemoreceptor Srx.